MKKVLTLTLIIGLGVSYGASAQSVSGFGEKTLKLEVASSSKDKTVPTTEYGDKSLKQETATTGSEKIIPINEFAEKSLKQATSASGKDKTVPTMEYGDKSLTQETATTGSEKIIPTNEFAEKSLKQEVGFDGSVWVGNRYADRDGSEMVVPTNEVEEMTLDQENAPSDVDADEEPIDVISMHKASLAFSKEFETTRFDEGMFFIYPTKAINELHVVSKAEGMVMVTIISLYGEVRFKQRIQDEVTIDVSHYPVGTYIVKIGTPNDFYTYKFFK